MSGVEWTDANGLFSPVVTEKLIHNTRVYFVSLTLLSTYSLRQIFPFLSLHSLYTHYTLRSQGFFLFSGMMSVSVHFGLYLFLFFIQNVIWFTIMGHDDHSMIFSPFQDNEIIYKLGQSFFSSSLLNPSDWDLYPSEVIGIAKWGLYMGSLKMMPVWDNSRLFDVMFIRCHYCFGVFWFCL